MPVASFLEKHLRLSLPEFVQLPPEKRSATARALVHDLHFFFDEGQPFAERPEPARTRDLAQSLFEALKPKEGSGRDDKSLAERIVTDSLLRSECDRDQNVYLGSLFTRRLTHAVPDVVFLPVNSAEVSAALRWGLGRHVPVTLRGAASTAMGGAVPAEGGLVLDLSRLDLIEVDAKDGVVVMGAGGRLRTVHKKLAERGLALSVYPSNLGGTYAGWFCTGGIGMNAYGRGRALDPVRSADVVMPRGEHLRLHADDRLDVHESHHRRTLAPYEREGWFLAHGYRPFTLRDLAGSEGQFGALTQLTVAVEPLPEIAPFLLAFDSEAEALAAVEWIGQRVAAGLEKPANVKLLSRTHLSHLHHVWEEEDGKAWHARPGAIATEDGLPWRKLVPPAECGARVADGEAHGSTAAAHDGPVAAPAAPAYLFVDFFGAAAGRAFVALLDGCPGRPRVLATESLRIARERFKPQQMKRLGPGLLAAEVLLPAARVPGFLPAAARVVSGAGAELDAEVYYLSDGTALAIAGYLTDHRKGSFALELPIAPALADLAMSRFEGRPYVLGRWQAAWFARKFPGKEGQRLRMLKRAVDRHHLLNRGAFFRMGLRGPLGLALAATFTPAIRVLRWAYAGAGPAVRAARGMLAGGPGPSAGRGDSALERPLLRGETPSGPLAAARALTCVNCGECNSVCPIFHESKIRLPQMLTHLGEAVHAGQALGPSGAVLLDLCMRCGNCEEACQAGIPHLPLYQVMQSASAAERPAERERDQERHAVLLEALRSSPRYARDFLDIRPGGYVKRAPASLPGVTRYVLLRAENDAGPSSTCIHCGACVDVCPTAANHEYQAGDLRIITTEQSRCIGCGTCVEVCPANHLNGGQTLRVMEAPTVDWFAAAREFATRELAVREEPQ